MMNRSRDVSEENAIIGRRIRELRTQKGLTLKEVGERVSLSVSYLSQIENGHVELNITNLKAISETLGVPLLALFVKDETPGISVTRRGERRWYDLGSEARESLLVRTRGNLEVFTIRLPAGSDPTENNSHEGEEFTYVLHGKIKMILNDEKVFELEEGDVIYYLSEIPHRWQNAGDATAEILVVNTPATF